MALSGSHFGVYVRLPIPATVKLFQTASLSWRFTLAIIEPGAFARDLPPATSHEGAKIEKIAFPPSLKIIGIWAFDGCDELTVSGLPSPDSFANIKLWTSRWSDIK